MRWRTAPRNSLSTTGCLSVSALGLIASLALLAVCDIFTGSRSLLPPAAVDQEKVAGRSTRRLFLWSTAGANSSTTTSRPAGN